MPTHEQPIAMMEPPAETGEEVDVVVQESIQRVIQQLEDRNVDHRLILQIIPELENTSTVAIPKSRFTILRKPDHGFYIDWHEDKKHAA